MLITVIIRCANLKLSDYLHFWVREFKLREFKTERKIVRLQF